MLNFIRAVMIMFYCFLFLVAVSTPGDSNVMYLVVIIKRAKTSKKHPETPPITAVTPVGTAFAISETHICTANHNVFASGHIQPQIGLLTEYEDPICKTDIIVATLVSNCVDGDEDWAVYQRTSGHFAHFAHVCPEDQLPVKNDKIGIRDYPVGLLTPLSSDKITMQSFHTKVAQYEAFVPINASSKKRKFTSGRVVDARPARPLERALQVVGGRVKGSCGAAYFAPNGKIVAFHVESLDDGSDSVSASNSYTSDRSHTSYSRGLLLCRLPKFVLWYNDAIPPILGTNTL